MLPTDRPDPLTLVTACRRQGRAGQTVGRQRGAAAQHAVRAPPRITMHSLLKEQEQALETAVGVLLQLP